MGDGAGKAGQELAMGTTGESLMGSLDDRFGRESLLGGGSRRLMPSRRAMTATFNPPWQWSKKWLRSRME